MTDDGPRDESAQCRIMLILFSLTVCNPKVFFYIRLPLEVRAVCTTSIGTFCSVQNSYLLKAVAVRTFDASRSHENIRAYEAFGIGPLSWMGDACLVVLPSSTDRAYIISFIFAS